MQYYKFTPEITGEYCFESSDNAADPVIWLYDSEFNQLGYNDDSGGSLNFKLICSLDEDFTYYIVTSPYPTTTGTYTFKTLRSFSYVHYYDSSFAANATLRNNITLANEFSDYVFTKYFGINFEMDGTASQYATVLDDCTTGSGNPCTNAACGSICNNDHHKNIWTIANQLYNSPREDEHVYILWTNRPYNTTYCCEEDGQHMISEAIACVFNSWPVIHFFNIFGDDEEAQLACMTLTLVHETTHTLKMDDVDVESHDVDENTVCIMEQFDEHTAYDFYKNVENGYVDPFCNSCMQILNELTEAPFYFGNQ
ncbi:MAG: hypothetical protein IKL40_06385 [Clostridia bacterium]|nr:hypothetical protein [Clostridia bacterium]